MSTFTILLLLAFIVSVLATFLVPSRVNLVALAMAFGFAALLIKSGLLF